VTPYHRYVVNQSGVQQPYEFLHATFGEFLVARAVVRTLEHACAQAMAADTFVDVGQVDASLFTFFSHQPLTNSVQLCSFVQELGVSTRPSKDELSEYIVKTLLRATTAEPPAEVKPYNPMRLTRVARIAAYSANLMILHLLLAGTLSSDAMERVRPIDAYSWWRSLALLWQSQFDNESWQALLSFVAVSRELPAGRAGVEEAAQAPMVLVLSAESPGSNEDNPSQFLARYISEVDPGLQPLVGDDQEEELGQSGEPVTKWLYNRLKWEVQVERFVQSPGPWGILSSVSRAQALLPGGLERGLMQDEFPRTAGRLPEQQASHLELFLLLSTRSHRLPTLGLEQLYRELILLLFREDAVHWEVLMTSALRDRSRLSTEILTALADGARQAEGPQRDLAYTVLLASVAIELLGRDPESASGNRLLFDVLASLDLVHMIDAEPHHVLRLVVELDGQGLDVGRYGEEVGSREEFVFRLDLVRLAMVDPGLPDIAVRLARKHASSQWRHFVSERSLVNSQDWEWGGRSAVRSAVHLPRISLSRLSRPSVLFLLASHELMQSVDPLDPSDGDAGVLLLSRWLEATGRVESAEQFLDALPKFASGGIDWTQVL
jgi:hypothetical protein